MLATRHRRPEVMDQPDLDPSRHEHALSALARINYFSRTASTLWPPLAALAKQQGGRLRLLDVASGAGDLVVRLARWARRRGMHWSLTGCDRSPVAIAHARHRAEAAGVEGVEFIIHDVVRDPLPAGFEVVMSSLFLHHLDNPEVCDLLRSFAAAAGRLVLVSDLVRGLSGLTLAHLATRLLTTSGVVHIDGPRSVEAAFTPAELRALAEEAGLAGATVVRRWPCRMLLTWQRPQEERP